MDLLSQKDKLPKATPSIQAWRQKGAEAFAQSGLPTRKDEDWKYTSVKPLGEQNFTPALLIETQSSHETLKYVGQSLCSDFTSIVFINGQLNKTLSNLEDLESGLIVSEVKNFSNQNFADVFDALNAAYTGQGVEITVEKEHSIIKPLHLFFYTTLEGGPALMVHPKVTIRVGQKSSVQVIESYQGQAGARYFVNSVSEILPERDSKIVYTRLQSESEQSYHIGRTQIVANQPCNIQSLNVSVGSLLSRQNLVLDLHAHGVTADILGVYCITNEQHLDHHTQMNHHVGQCNSIQLYKGILNGKSRAVFNGKVYIHKDAQKANSEQLNGNLLLSSQAEVDAKPQLEIYADDVKASHGATIGQLNKEELFYLLSRGIRKDQAIPMLSYGFLSGVIDRLDSEVTKNWLKKILHEKFVRMNAGQNELIK